MRIRWKEFLLATGITLGLSAFTVSCVPFWETKSDAVEESAEKKEKEEPPLGTMDRMEQQAEQGELAPPAQEKEPPGVHPRP